jgi:hypothetical protein
MAVVDPRKVQVVFIVGAIASVGVLVWWLFFRERLSQDTSDAIDNLSSKPFFATTGPDGTGVPNPMCQSIFKQFAVASDTGASLDKLKSIVDDGVAIGCKWALDIKNAPEVSQVGLANAAAGRIGGL